MEQATVGRPGGVVEVMTLIVDLVGEHADLGYACGGHLKQTWMQSAAEWPCSSSTFSMDHGLIIIN